MTEGDTENDVMQGFAAGRSAETGEIRGPIGKVQNYKNVVLYEFRSDMYEEEWIRRRLLRNTSLCSPPFRIYSALLK